MLAIGTRVKVKGVSESGVYVNGIGTVTEAYYEVRMSDGHCRLMDECAVLELGEDKTQDGRNTLPNMLYR